MAAKPQRASTFTLTNLWGVLLVVYGCKGYGDDSINFPLTTCSAINFCGVPLLKDATTMATTDATTGLANGWTKMLIFSKEKKSRFLLLWSKRWSFAISQLCADHNAFQNRVKNHDRACSGLVFCNTICTIRWQVLLFSELFVRARLVVAIVAQVLGEIV